MSNPPLMLEALRHDHLGLMSLIEATARRQTVPCFNGRDVPREWWTSDSLAERNKAAKECGTCSVLKTCRSYGIDHPKEAGTYGGLVESQREQAAREIRNRRTEA